MRTEKTLRDLRDYFDRRSREAFRLEARLNRRGKETEDFMAADINGHEGRCFAQARDKVNECIADLCKSAG